jgi:alkylation response protein AidB-like acyl-CoA dehydrogenase
MTIETIADVLRQHARDVDIQARFPVEAMQVLRTEGYLGYLVPTEYGGMGASLSEFVDAAKTLAGACLSTAMIWAMHCQQVDVLVRHGSAELRRRVLPRIADGEIYLASVTTENTKGGNLLAAGAPITQQDGRAWLRRDAPVVTGGAHADGFLITMRTDTDADPSAVTLVYADRTDLTINHNGTWNPLGMRGTESGGLVLEGPVAEHGIIGRPGEFRAVACDSMIPLGHLAWSACWLGAAQQAFAALVARLGQRGRGGPDTSSPLIRERIGRIRLDLELVSAYLGRVTQEIGDYRAHNRSTDVTPVHIHLNTLKLAAADLTFQAVDRMVQLAGLSLGYSADSELPLERTFRDLRSAALNYANDRLWTANGALCLVDRQVRLA